MAGSCSRVWWGERGSDWVSAGRCRAMQEQAGKAAPSTHLPLPLPIAPAPPHRKRAGIRSHPQVHDRQEGPKRRRRTAASQPRGQQHGAVPRQQHARQGLVVLALHRQCGRGRWRACRARPAPPAACRPLAAAARAAARRCPRPPGGLCSQKQAHPSAVCMHHVFHRSDCPFDGQAGARVSCRQVAHGGRLPPRHAARLTAAGACACRAPTAPGGRPAARRRSGGPDWRRSTGAGRQS